MYDNPRVGSLFGHVAFYFSSEAQSLGLSDIHIHQNPQKGSDAWVLTLRGKSGKEQVAHVHFSQRPKPSEVQSWVRAAYESGKSLGYW